jgi:hypothetical protein
VTSVIAGGCGVTFMPLARLFDQSATMAASSIPDIDGFKAAVDVSSSFKLEKIVVLVLSGEVYALIALVGRPVGQVAVGDNGVSFKLKA